VEADQFALNPLLVMLVAAAAVGAAGAVVGFCDVDLPLENDPLPV